MSKSKESKTVNGQRGRSYIVIGVVLAFLIGGAVGVFWKTAQTTGPDADAVRDFLTRYFKTWSSKDMDGYANCFDSTSMVYFIQDGQVVLRQDKPDFIAGQTQAVRMAPASLEEHAVTTEIMIEGDVAYARVYWKLTKNGQSSYGYDHFILLHMAQGWQIISLSFYELPEKH